VLTANLPWHLRYQSFSGALPNISAIAFQIIGFEYRIRETISAIACLFRSTEAHPLNMEWNRVSTGSVTEARLTGVIPSTVSPECGGGLELNASSRPTGFTPSTTITLI